MPVQRVKDRGELPRRRWLRRDVTRIVEDGSHSDCGRSQTPTAMRTQRGDLGFHSGDRAPRCVLRRHLTGLTRQRRHGRQTRHLRPPALPIRPWCSHDAPKCTQNIYNPANTGSDCAQARRLPPTQP
jgi:hypothetical protein